jgi:hypothetical protein
LSGNACNNRFFHLEVSLRIVSAKVLPIEKLAVAAGDGAFKT